MSSNFIKPVICLFFLGIASLSGAGCVAGNAYGTTFNNAVASGESEVFYTSKPFDDFLKTFMEVLKNVGYERVIYKNPTGDFIVIVKNVNLAGALIYGDPASHKILIKFTQSDNDRTRIDLVNGSTYVVAKQQVAADIKSIAQKLAVEEV